MVFNNNPRKKRGIFTICLIISAVVRKKLEKGSLSFHPKIMKNISKCSQNNVVPKATSIFFLHYVPDFFNKSLINTFLLVSV